MGSVTPMAIARTAERGVTKRTISQSTPGRAKEGHKRRRSPTTPLSPALLTALAALLDPRPRVQPSLVLLGRQLLGCLARVEVALHDNRRFEVLDHRPVLDEFVRL